MSEVERSIVYLSTGEDIASSAWSGDLTTAFARIGGARGNELLTFRGHLPDESFRNFAVNPMHIVAISPSDS